MGLSMDHFREASKPKEYLCPVARLLGDLSPEDRKVLESALADRKFTHVGIANVLMANGHKMSQGAIGYHRRNDCACAR